MFFNIDIEFTEKEVVDEYIHALIDVATKNDNTYNDYLSIIAILYKLKETYPKFDNIYNEYLYEFDKKGYLKEFENKKHSNNVYKSLKDLKQFDEPSWDLIPERYMWFSTCIALLGTPNIPKITNKIARWCSWNFYDFAKPAIYYTKLLIKQGFYDKDGGNYDDNPKQKRQHHRFNIYVQLAENYLKIGDGYNAKKYFLKAKQQWPKSQINLTKKIKQAETLIDKKVC